MADRAIKVTLRADVQDFKRQFDEAAKASEKSAKAVESSSKRASQFVEEHADSINSLSNVSLGAGAALTAFAGAAISSAAEFDQAMSNVQAGSMETADNMELLRQAALDAGASTVYSATEAAGAIETLAKAGLSTQDILGGGLAGALDLAASGGIDVGQAAEIASVAMKQFGLEGRDVTHIADLLAAGAGKAVGDVDDLGMALNQAGTVANSFGLSVDETVGGLAAFAEAGMIGSDAGTMLKTMLQQLGNPTKESAQLMEDLGISVYDANGQFIGLDGVAGELQTAFQGMDMESRNAAMGVIFGADAIRGANVLYQEGEAGIQAWNTAVNDQGYAAEQAALRLDNLKGDLEELGGAFETAFIGMGEGQQGPLRGLVQGATDVVNAFNDLPDAAQSALGMGTGIAGLSLLAVGGTGRVITSLSETKLAMKNLGIEVDTAGKKLKLLGVGSAAGLAITGLAMAVSHFASESVKAQANADALASTFDELTGAATASTDTMILEQLNEHISAGDWEQLKEIGYSYSDVVNAIKEGGPAYEQLWSDIEATRIAQHGWSEESRNTSAAMSHTADALREVGPAYQQAAEQQSELTAGSQELGHAQEQGGEAAAIAAEQQALLDGAIEETGVSLEGTIEKMSEFLEMLFATGLATMSTRDATAAYHEAVAGVDPVIDQLIEDHGTLSSALNDAATDFDLTTAAGRDANGAFQEIAKSGIEVAESMAEADASQDEIQRSLRGTYDDLVTAAGQFGITGDAAEDLAREVLGVPDNVDIDTWMDSEAERQAGATQRAIEGIDRSVTVTTVFRTIGTQPTMTRGRTTAVGAWATGGPVVGPGTGTSDSIPAMLSNGEHVFTAREVKAAGGHGAVSQIRAAILRGSRYAEGGPVGATFTPMPASAFPAAPVASGTGISLAGIESAVRAGAHAGAAAGVAEYRPVMRLGDRDFYGEMVRANKRFGRK
ncbi:phage tail tape measure protein [Brachybacterium paraconglomeratum]|uniref:phage tail tape measure protein n=1 Tax=Brachybacterium paraconglomeratum TaxID=173362 RepID=UPI003FD3F0B5